MYEITITQGDDTLAYKFLLREDALNFVGGALEVLQHGGSMAIVWVQPKATGTRTIPESFATLEHGWHGGEGEAITPEALHQAYLLLERLSGNPGVFPTPKGGIQYEYSTPDDEHYLEIEIEPNGSTGILWIEGAYEFDLEDLTTDTVVEITDKFLERIK